MNLYTFHFVLLDIISARKPILDLSLWSRSGHTICYAEFVLKIISLDIELATQLVWPDLDHRQRYTRVSTETLEVQK